MSTHLPGFQSFSIFLHHFVMPKLVTSSIRVKDADSFDQKWKPYFILLQILDIMIILGTHHNNKNITFLLLIYDIA